ncbi:MAG: 2-dehydropantoate 2-reductase N-terminal domain-containing protein [Candidatus Thorarchaeota archaeon]|jgi:2-dehydropantoate 2-reductase
MKILVCGAGIQGSYLSSILLKAGVDVTLLARKKRLEDIETNGVRLAFHPSEKIVTTDVPTISPDELDNSYDAYIVIMQKHQAIQFSSTLSEHISDSTVAYIGNNGTGTLDYEQYIPSQNIILGFLGMGGYRKEDYMRVTAVDPVKVWLGAINTKSNPRLQEFISLMQTAGFKPDVPSSIDAWLKCHLALILPIAGAIYGAYADNYRLARTPGLLRLMHQGLKEAFQVIKKLGYPILPRRMQLIIWLPEWLAIRVYKKRFAKEEAEIALAGHAKAAQSEMKYIFEEFKDLMKQADISTPHLDYLLKLTIPGTPPIEEGIESIPIS